MRKPFYKDCTDDNGELDSNCYETAMSDYEDSQYDEAKDRRMEDELDEFAELAGMPYSKAIQAVLIDPTTLDGGIEERITLDSYPIRDKKVSEVISDIKNGYFITPF